MAGDNAINPEDDGGSRRTSLSNRRCYPYRKDNNFDDLYRSPSSRSVNHGSGTSIHRNRNRQNGNRDCNLNWKGQPRAKDPDPSFIAGQIMFLPARPKFSSRLQVWGSDGNRLDKKGYEHPVLILTNPDNEGYVIVQKMTSFDGRTLAENFPNEHEIDRTNKASYMQIDDGKPADPDATIVLHLYNDHNTWPAYLRKRSFVETIMSYKCRLEFLRPYDNYGKPWFVDLASLDLAVARVLLARFPPSKREETQNKVAHLNTNSHPNTALPLPPRKAHFQKKPGQVAQSEHPAQRVQPVQIEQPESPHQSSKPPRPVRLDTLRTKLRIHSRKDKLFEDFYSEDKEMKPRPSNYKKRLWGLVREIRRGPTFTKEKTEKMLRDLELLKRSTGKEGLTE